ncbi:MAG TPA: hypothetical protein VFV38_01680 [Ktedonobacteraceae bacterium]|nr:hypothetical protein [Ktedonobacteraceae bacterium]
MIHQGQCHSCQLSVIPDSSRVSVSMALEQTTTFFDECTGNAWFVPARALPSALRREYPTTEGTLIEDYTPVLKPFLYQFARNWMGRPREKKAYLAAPVEHVRGALDDDLFLVRGPETLTRIVPEDCNIHWRGFTGEPHTPPGADPSGFALLLTFLRKAGVALLEDEVDGELLELCQRWSIPLRREAGKLSCSSRSATSFVWFLSPERKPSGEARLATVFAFWYGMDID